MLALYSAGMADYVLRELEIGPRAASFEDSEACGWSALMDLDYEEYVRNHKEMDSMTDTQELDTQENTGPAVLEEAPGSESYSPVPVSMVPEPERQQEPHPVPDAGWVLKVTPKHNCILPSVDTRTFVGSIWRCGECGQHYLVIEKRGDNAGQKALRRISDEKAAEKMAAAEQ